MTYHAIRAGAPPLCVASERLASDLELFLSAGFEPRPLTSLLAAPRPGAGPTLSVTFDDGYRDFLESALPVLEAHAVPATLFAVAGDARDRLPGGAPGALLGFDELAEIARRGVALGAHGLAHLPLTRMDDAELARELRGSRERLEACADATVDLLAYPFGAFDARVRRAAGAAGYRIACTTQLAPLPARFDPLAVPRLDAFYLASPRLRWLLARGRAAPYLHVRRWLRRLRGSEPRRPVPRGRRPTRAA